MSDLETPDSIIRELVAIRQEAARGVDFLHAAETKLAKASLEAQHAEDAALLSAEGTVPERQAQARLRSEDARFAEALARAELNRVRAKLKVLEQAQMNVQTQARLVELMYRTAGLGEH